MSAGEFLGEEEFSIAVTVGRVAYLLKPGSANGFRRAVQEACTRWGGMTEPIIPVYAPGRIEPFWRQVVELAGVDEVVNVDLDPDVAVAASKSLNLPLISLTNIDRAGLGRFSCYPTVITGTTTQSPWLYAEGNLDLWAITAAGSVGPSVVKAAIELGDPIVETKFPDQVGRAQIGARTVISRTIANFEEFRASPSPFPSPAIIWIAGSRPFRDCLFFWNCRALRSLRFAPMPVIILPGNELHHWVNFAQSIHSMLAHRSDEFSPDVLLGSSAVPHHRLREIGALLGLVESDDEIRTSRTHPPPPERTPPFTFKVGFDIRTPLIFERGYGSVTWAHAQVFRDRTNLKFESPVNFNGFGQVLLRIGSSAFKWLPQRPEVAPLVDAYATWSPDGLQIATMALNRYALQLRIPSRQEVIGVVLKAIGVAWKLSDKGRMGDSINQASGFHELLSAGMYEAVRALTTRRSRQILKDLQNLKLTGQEVDIATLVSDLGGRLERLSQHAGQIGDIPKDDRVRVLERLVSLGWAERGCRIVCGSCGITSFVQLHDVEADAPCSGCHTSQHYESGPTGLTIFYRLNSLIDRASDQGVLPHLLVQAVLGREDPTCLVYPGIDVEFPDNTKAEVDLFGLFRGKVVAGEVKTNPHDFTSRQLTRDFELSSRLSVDTHVMATLGEIPLERRAKAELLAKRYGLEVIVLDKHDLRPKPGNGISPEIAQSETGRRQQGKRSEGSSKSKAP